MPRMGPVRRPAGINPTAKARRARRPAKEEASHVGGANEIHSPSSFASLRALRAFAVVFPSPGCEIKWRMVYAGYADVARPGGGGGRGVPLHVAGGGGKSSWPPGAPRNTIAGAVRRRMTARPTGG